MGGEEYRMNAAHHLRCPAIAIERDLKGLRLALLELLEEGFQAAKIERLSASMAPERRQALLDAVAEKRSLTPGYYAFAEHVLGLDAERNAGIPLNAATLAHFEGMALRLLASCRIEHSNKHPRCGRCGVEQENRHHPECTHCGCKFVRRGGR
jgi:hypothetical protein